MAFLLPDTNTMFGESSTRRWLCVTGATVASLYSAQKLVRWNRRRTDQARRDALWRQRHQEISTLENTLDNNVDSEEAIRVTDMPFDLLKKKLKSGELRPTQVLRAYQWRALVAQGRTNCLVKVIPEAMGWAAELEKDPSRQGVLYGVPVSIKEGLFQNDETYTLLCEGLRHEGAVPFVVTNYPQALMSLESDNPIYGPVTHPLDAEITPGGSSGGEAALLACNGSPLGFGGDLGGSIRIPGHFSGICGLKPTSTRVTLKGVQFAGFLSAVPATAGPMARDVDTLVTAMEALLSPMMYINDRNVVPLPFKSDEYQDDKQLRIGYYIDNGSFPASPPCARAVMIAKNVLEDQGHVLIRWKPPRATFCQHAWWQCILGDQGKLWTKAIGDEPINQCIKYHYDCTFMPVAVREIRIWLAKLRGDGRYAAHLRACAGVRTVSDWWTLVDDVHSYQRDFEEHWLASELDAVICPPAIVPAPLRGNCAGPLFSVNSDSFIANIMDYPAGVLPITNVTKMDIKNTDNFNTGDVLDSWVRATVARAEGLPVGVQCITPRWQEELCLRVMKDIENGARFERTPPVIHE